jgi:hypothetical protein
MMIPSIALCCALWCLRLLTSASYRNFIAAALLAVLGTFSFSTGLAIWPAALFLIFCIPRPPAQKMLFGIVIAATAYLFLQQPPAAQDMAPGKNYFYMPLFFLLSLGAPVGFAAMGTAAIAALAGLMMLIAGRPTLESLKARPFVVALMLLGFGMLMILTIVRGAGSNPILGMDSRYGSISALCWVGIILLVDWTGWRKYVLMLLVALCLIRDAAMVRRIVDSRRTALVEVAGIKANNANRFILKGDHTSPQQFDQDIELMREWHYSLFRTN